MGAEPHRLPPGERYPACFECLAPLPLACVPQRTRCLAGSGSICLAPGSCGVGSLGGREKKRALRFLLFQFCLLPVSFFWPCRRRGKKIKPLVVRFWLAAVRLRSVEQDCYQYAARGDALGALVEAGGRERSRAGGTGAVFRPGAGNGTGHDLAGEASRWGVGLGVGFVFGGAVFDCRARPLVLSGQAGLATRVDL